MIPIRCAISKGVCERVRAVSEPIDPVREVMINPRACLNCPVLSPRITQIPPVLPETPDVPSPRPHVPEVPPTLPPPRKISA